MAMGKVVFTGAEREFEQYYQLSETVAINALPDPEDIAGKLSQLIEDPSQISGIGQNARNFVEKYHSYNDVMKLYMAAWTSPAPAKQEQKKKGQLALSFF